MILGVDDPWLFIGDLSNLLVQIMVLVVPLRSPVVKFSQMGSYEPVQMKKMRKWFWW